MSAVRSRISSKLISASCVGYFDMWAPNLIFRAVGDDMPPSSTPQAAGLVGPRTCLVLLFSRFVRPA